MVSDKVRRRLKRKLRVRSKISGNKLRPRVSVYRSHRYFYGQLIDDTTGTTITSIVSGKGTYSDLRNNVEDLGKLGEQWGKKIIQAGIEQVVFDTNGFRYHGKVQSFADGMRRGGVRF